MMRFLRTKLSALPVIFTLFTVLTAWAQEVPYTLNHGFGGPTGLPAGIEIVSYDGATACATSSNGATAVTNLLLKAQPGYNFTITSIDGTGVRSNAGSTQFNFRLINNGTVNGAVTTVASSSSCGGGTAISTLTVPAANQLVMSGAMATISIPRSAGSTSGGGYTHVKTLVIKGTVSVQAPIATAATTLTTAGFTANWLEVTGATGYRLDVSTDANFNTLLEDYDNFAVDGTSQYIFLGILPNTPYYYRVRAEISAQASANSNVIATATPACGIIPLPVAAPHLFCGSGTVGQLMANGDGTINWYANETGGAALDPVYALTTSTYYVSQTIAKCESDRVAVAVTVNEIPAAPQTAAEQVFCGPATISQLKTITGTSLSWYLEATGGRPLSADTPVITGNYYVTQTVNGCESPRAFTEATILPIPVAAAADSQFFCGSGKVSQLKVLTGAAPLWYTAQTGGDALLEDATLTTATYYVSQTVNGCESPRAAVAITVNPIPDAPVAASQLFCGSGTIASLQVTTGLNPQWYASLTGGSPLPADVPVGTATYYVSQTVNGCESARTAVAVTVNPVPAAPVAAPQLICGSGTVAGLMVTTGANAQWYMAQTGGDALTADTAITTGTYYVSQTVGGCESARTEVTVTVNPAPDAPVAAAQHFCGAGTVGLLNVTTGTAPKWYIAQTGGSALTENLPLGSAMYYVSQTVNGCESARTAVAVTVTPVPAAPTAPALAFCGATTASQMTVTTGTAPKWYTAETGGEALAGTATLETGTYYVSQTINECEGPRTAVAVKVTVVEKPEGVEKQDFTEGKTLADLVVTGENLVWYADAELKEKLPLTTVLADEAIYYVVSNAEAETCMSEVLAITVNEVLSVAGYDKANFKVYPNPVNDILTVSYTQNITSVIVYNLLGQPIITQQANAASAEINMAALAAGTYVVKALSEDKAQIFKVLKK